MPTYSELTLTFIEDFDLNNALNIYTTQNDVLSSSFFVWKSTRSVAFEVEQGTPTANPGERSALNFKTAFDLDTTGYITTVQNTNEVLIQSETQGEFFVSFRGPTGKLSGQFVNDGDESTITVMVPKYYIEYCDDFNTDREVLILQKGYVGQSKELLADVNPISVTYESSEDFKFSPIRPSTAEVHLIFDSEGSIQFDEFWTADEREFQVQDIKDGDIEWIGYVIPNGFEYDFHGGLYYATLTASDGLASLESLTFVDDNNKPYGLQDLVYNNGFLFPPILIFTEILRKLDLDLDLWTCVDSYEQTMTKTGDTRNADPLATCFVNTKTYINSRENQETPYWHGSGEEWNCKEVAENLLYMFGAKLYQEDGIWRIKSINADVDFGTGDTQRYWRKYNTAAVYLSDFEVVNDEVNVPCGDGNTFLKGNDHLMSMDVVYKAFRMNYEYTFLRDGDTPINLVPNGNFCDFNNTSILSAPDGWERWIRDNDKWYIRIKDITLAESDAGGQTCGIEIGTHKAGIPTSQGNIRTDPNPAIWTALKNSNYDFIERGSDLSFSIWVKYRYQSLTGGVQYYPFFRCMLWTTDGQFYFLRNSIVDNQRALTWEQGEVETRFGFTFIKQVFFYLPYQSSQNGTSADQKTYDWWEFKYDIPNAPAPGYIEFYIHGLAADKGRDSENFPSPYSYQDGVTYNNWLRVVRENWVDEGGDIPRMQVTGVVVGLIPNENELPQQQDFIYNNPNGNYSYQTDPITIYNGDLQDEYHISNITVPSNTSGGKNFWDDLSNTYGKSSLGLLTVREIMRQYQKPYRVFEGEVKIQDARFGSVYTFSAIPNVRFILQRGTFNKQKQYIENATFVQITDDALPVGGTEGGNTLDPEWVPTGTTYCQVGPDGLNTGFVITEERDLNPNSESYDDTREVISDAQDTDSCPLTESRLYFWGSDDIYLNTATLNFAPFTEISDKEIQVSLDNTDGNYLYFVHLKTLGVVERIYTVTTPGNVISDWVYLSDVIIDGYRYRVLRTDYVMSEFTGFTHNFKFA